VRPVGAGAREVARRREVPFVAALVAALVFGGASGAATYWRVSVAGSASAEGRALTPTPPGDVSASCSTTTKAAVTLTWSAIPDASTYTIYESKTGGAYTAVASTSATTWTSGTLKKRSTYSFEVATTIGATWLSAPSTPTTALDIHGKHCT
jgi:hypothetical protein